MCNEPVTFEGNICTKCGNRTRYVKSHNCSHCTKEYTRRYSRTQKEKILPAEATGPFTSESGYNGANILLKLSETALNRLDEIGYGLIKKYKMGGLTQNRVRLIGLAYLIDED
ncbi:hypothetical protein AU509_03015 [Lonsdalea britannica]|uniref:Uncharacterized protein n=1 Tax=Lonsdalea britannica TaxID=1082704 RepID=A0AAD0WKX0_9GAMM|nr:hypothetical protein CKQ53_09955 [Lonsdalea britannica]OSM99794.1 hypothetical protein AU509_03015 [Lonsdalea britannica]